MKSNNSVKNSSLIIINLLLITITNFLLINNDQALAQDLNTIKISALLHLTGDFAMEGSAFREGIELAVEQENKELRKLNQEIVIDYQDTRYIAKEVVALAQKATSDPAFKAMIISTFVEAKPIAGILEKNKMPGIVLWDATPEIDSFGDYIFAIGPWAPDTAGKSARFSVQILKAKTAAIIFQQNDFSLAVADLFEKKFKTLGGTITSQQLLNPDETDFKTYLTRIRMDNPDVVYAPVVYGMGTFIKQFKQLLPNTKIITSDIINDHLIKEDPKNFENVYSSMVADPDNFESKKLKEIYLDKYKKQISMLMFNAWGYDALKIYAEAIKRGARTREEIKNEIYKIKDLQGATGLIAFNERGSAPKYISMFQVRDGKLELISGPDPE